MEARITCTNGRQGKRFPRPVPATPCGRRKASPAHTPGFAAKRTTAHTPAARYEADRVAAASSPGHHGLSRLAASTAKGCGAPSATAGTSGAASTSSVAASDRASAPSA